jgi:hypothetical protein
MRLAHSQVPTTRKGSIKKEYSEVTIEKCYKGQNLISFVARRE